MDLATFSRVTLADFASTGRGAALLCDVKQGDVLLEVPLDRCWTAEAARQFLVTKELESGEITEKEAIIAHLMMAKTLQEDSEGSGHLAMLPSLESMNLPAFWKDSDLQLLEGSEVHTHAVRLQEELLEDFEELQKKLRCKEKVDFETFQWAWSIYSSRVMSLTRPDGTSIFAIVPGLDMFNHSPHVSTGLFQLGEDVVCVKAGEDLMKGQQAFINYAADMYNSQMLLSFGFILDDSDLQSSEVTLSLQVSPAQLEVHRKLLDSLEGPLSRILHLPSGNDSELIVKHVLTWKTPLPAAFLAQVRIQHMDLNQQRMESVVAQAAYGLTAKDEIRTLLLISMLLEGKLQELQRPERSGPVILALRQCAGERVVLREALAEVDRMILATIRKALSSLKSTAGRDAAETAETAQTPWLHRLNAASSRLSAEVSSVARLSKNLCDRLPKVHLIQACHIFNAWLVGRNDHELLPRLCFAKTTWPFDQAECDHTDASASILGLEADGQKPGGGYAGQPSSGAVSSCENPYLSLYHEKMKLWGSWLLAQWIHADAFQLSDLSSMGQEQVMLRNHHAWSVPSDAALRILASHAPLLELGAGTGYWASLLKQRSVDIVAFDEKHFHSSFNSQTDISEGQEISSRYFCDVKQGGPESVGQYEDRTLLLMWPDYMGFGAYGLQCLQHYKGQKLILIGEWKNSTFGSYSKGVSEHGQSFSLEFQNKVEDEEV